MINFNFLNLGRDLKNILESLLTQRGSEDFFRAASDGFFFHHKVFSIIIESFKLEFPFIAKIKLNTKRATVRDCPVLVSTP